MRGDLLCMLERAVILKISGDPGRPKSMAAGGVGQGSSFVMQTDFP